MMVGDDDDDDDDGEDCIDMQLQKLRIPEMGLFETFDYVREAIYIYIHNILYYIILYYVY